ncbi:hypothetical protein ASF10_19250 [Flavobacterium sp. Leaf82]|uniref:hypothetical protein n=1 Tax=Flavobacterium sp. Leaf82 TaxID=1736238 RepID=UPI0006FB725B|nr:hypothetical protein [Flavobacterium sp. Leaf82]KQO33212.1 hypothetical protein ASF10_19250 [Flavobacterium sp. Leaf82]
MDLFHVSTKKYHVGQIIKAKDFENTEYYQNATNQNKNWIDEFLDINKPANAPERKKAIYAFDCVENCVAFKGQNNDNFYYKVKMLKPIACPMSLTDALKREDEENNLRIANEYWNYNENWKFLEYLSSEMQIIEIIPPPNIILVNKGKMNYSSDRELTQRLLTLYKKKQ